MKKLCLGTMITLLYQSRMRSADKIKTVCGGIFAAYGLNINGFNQELPSHLKSGHDPAPSSLVDAARYLSIDDIDRGFKEFILPLIHNDMHEALFRAIKAVLREDTAIPATARVGKSDGYEKDSILNSTTFEESALLANVLTYAITSTENDKLKANIKEIGKGYVNGFIDSDEEIHFVLPEVDQDQYSPLKRTLKTPMFDRIFKKATEITITGMSNPARVCVFYIDPNNCKFRFRDLKQFINDNISGYVLSRAQAKRIFDRTKSERAIGSEAMRKFIFKYGSRAETILGEILLYVFMEQELDAPKIMSRLELDEYSRNMVSKSDGIHLLSVNNFGQPFYQLVFGASDIIGDLTAAVDRAFEKIKEIENNSDDELRMVESTTQRTIYDPETTKLMVELMTPHRDGSFKLDMAFGAFLGYTMKMDTPETDSVKYRIEVKEQLKRDIAAVQPHISKLIRKNRLSGYSFYLYVMPFNDAPNEKVSIIQELLSGGDI